MSGCGGVALERCSVSAVVAAVALAVAMWRGLILYCFYKVLRNWHIFWLLRYLQYLVSMALKVAAICNGW